MAGGSPRYDQAILLSREILGGSIYASAVLLGEKDPGKVQPLSYLALYPNGNILYLQVAPGSLTKQEAAGRVLSLSYPRNIARAENQSARAIVAGESAADVDEVIWKIGLHQTTPLGLPVIFIAWTRQIVGNQVQVTLWYPSMTQGPWALARIQRVLRGNR